MSFEATILEPKTNIEQQDVIGLYPLPFEANMQNSGDRLQALADRVGFPIIVSDLVLQTKRTIFDMKAREANQPSGNTYRDMSRRRVDFFQEQAAAFSGATTLGIGDSLCVPVIQGMQLHSGAEPVFNAILLRDGWNLDPRGDRLVGGAARYVSYIIRDKLHELKRTAKFDIPDSGWSDTEPTAVNETSIREKLVNVADLMRGPENRENALLLARYAVQAGFAMNVMLFDNGLSGNSEQRDDFMTDIAASRKKAMQQITFGQKIGRVHVETTEGWHSDLLDPVRGAADVQHTLALARRGA